MNICGKIHLTSENAAQTKDSMKAHPNFRNIKMHFSTLTAPKGIWEQNEGDWPQQIVHTCRGEWWAEHHDNSSSKDCFFPGLGLQYSVVGVEVLADHKEDHGHCNDPQHRQVPPWQHRGTGQDGWGVDAGQSTIHKWDPAWKETQTDKHRQDVTHA